jgi:hypothetical protein
LIDGYLEHRFASHTIHHRYSTLRPRI